jgi:hypothetical protein
VSVAIGSVSEVVTYEVQYGFFWKHRRDVKAVVVACDREGCAGRYTIGIRHHETHTNAKKRAVREALAGAWRRVGEQLYCGRCVP